MKALVLKEVERFTSGGVVTDWSISLASFCVSVLELVWVKITPPEPMYWYHEEKPCLSATSKDREIFQKKRNKENF